MTDFILTTEKNIEDRNKTIYGFAGNWSESGKPVKMGFFTIMKANAVQTD